MTLGQLIKQKRKSRGLSQEALASLIGVTKQMISLYERDENEPSKSALTKLLQELDFDVKYENGVIREVVNEPAPEYSRQDNNQRIADLETLVATLRETVSDLRADKKRLQEEIDRQSKKRDPKMEDGGSIVSARRKE